MLVLQSDSRVVMITSAGCNALDYLLDDPAEIHAIDMNPRQKALLELKMAVIQHGDYDELFNMLGNGLRPGFEHFLPQLHLPAYARRFWREKKVLLQAGALQSILLLPRRGGPSGLAPAPGLGEEQSAGARVYRSLA